MSTSFPTITIAPLAQPRKRARTLPRMALAFATLASAGLFNAAHATYPGENGVIVFTSKSSDGSQLVIKKASPGNSATTILSLGNSPSVSPNGKKVAFVKNWDVYVMNIDGSNVVQLTTGQSSSSPTWLPDGSKVAYGLYVDGSHQTVELWAVKPDGTGKTFLRKLDGTASSIDFAWIPSPTLGGGNLYSFNGTAVGGLNLANDVNSIIATIATNGTSSSWAPDAQTILYKNSDGQQFEINWTTGALRNVPSPGSIYGSSAISPDGAFIAAAVSGQLATRPRAGTSTTFSWADAALEADWSRVPKNCYASTPQGGGGAFGDIDFYADQCAIVVMPDNGQKGVFQQALAVGPDSRLYHRSLLTSGSWTPFVRVPGVAGNPNGINVKKIAIAASKDGSAQVVIINAADNALYHAMRQTDGTWSGFAGLDGFGGAANFAARDVAITINGSTPTSPGNAQVIANGLNAGGVFHRVRWPAGNWSPFAEVPGMSGVNTHELAIAASEDGNTNVLATTSAINGSNAQIMQALRFPSSNWGAWVTVGLPTGTTLSASSDVAMTRTLIGTAQLMFTDAAGNTFLQERANPNLASSWQLSPTAQPIINAGRVLSMSPGATPGSTSQLLITRGSSQ